MNASTTTNVKQDGFVLIVVLVLLVAMTLLGIGLTRITDTTIQIANNIAFKQSSLSAADSGIEQAIEALSALGDKAHDSPADGYYATQQTGRDFTGLSTPDDSSDDVSWTGNASSTQRAKVGTTVGGNKVAYIIHRLCDKQGPLHIADDGTANSCGTSSFQSPSGASKGGGAYGNTAIPGKTTLYYRITVRTEGARNTVSYVQAHVLLEY